MTEGTPPATRVLLVDDHVLVRDGLKRVVNDQPDMEVVAEAGEGREALRLAQNHAPDIALLDVSMPGLDGVILAEEMRRSCHKVRIIAVTRYDDEGFVRRMLEAGASGYVRKQSSSIEVVRAIRAVAQGYQYIDPGVRRSAPDSGTSTASQLSETGAGEPLTSQEEDVLRLLAASNSTQQIAEQLGLTLEDVAIRKTSAMQKSGLRTRLQIISFARSRGWLER